MAQKDSGQGRVKDPEHDGRLKENREGGSKAKAQDDRSSSGDGRGKVKDPEHDGRLKQNR
jgi:hypothetical protein